MGGKIFATIKDQVYEKLKEDICAGRFQAGQRLQEVELAEELSVSRTPVREALRQLVHDGIAVEIPNKGVYVREFTLKDVQEIYNMRLLLEGYAFDLMESTLTKDGKKRLVDILQELQAAYDRRDLAEYIRWDTALHECFILLANDNMLRMVYRGIQTMIQQFRVHSLSAQGRFEESMKEHTDTVDCILADVFRRAKQTNNRHLELAKEELVRYVTSQ